MYIVYLSVSNDSRLNHMAFYAATDCTPIFITISMTLLHTLTSILSSTLSLFRFRSFRLLSRVQSWWQWTAVNPTDKRAFQMELSSVFINLPLLYLLLYPTHESVLLGLKSLSHASTCVMTLKRLGTNVSSKCHLLTLFIRCVSLTLFVLQFQAHSSKSKFFFRHQKKNPFTIMFGAYTIFGEFSLVVSRKTSDFQTFPQREKKNPFCYIRKMKTNAKIFFQLLFCCFFLLFFILIEINLNSLFRCDWHN